VSVTAWRVTKRKHARNAFSGEGAREFGGRWNNPGTAVVYTAQSQSLAALEMLVHLDSADLLEKYALLAADFDQSLIKVLNPSDLPRNWRADTPPAQVRSIGDEWVWGGSSAVIRVPSVLVPGESNFLLNPGHQDFARIRFGKAMAFRFDARLGK
jgi:RES domain-containing protein